MACNTSMVSEKEMARQKDIYDSREVQRVCQEGSSQISYELDAITEKEQSSKGYVEVLAWKSAEASEKYYAPTGEMDTLDSPYLTWVVQAGEYPQKIRDLKLDRLSGQKLALRLEQALGLPPAGDTTRVFIAMEVKVEDLFRPCRDPEVNDCSCSHEFPEGYYSQENDYLAVYESLIISTTDFPWTRLGYTYDWNEKSKDHFGFSEYIIRQGAVVRISARFSTEEFLH